LLETLSKFPERQFTINELAGRVGRSVTVKLHKSEYLDSVSSLLNLSVTPQAFTAMSLKALLAKEDGVRRAYLFGSVARGEEKPGSDVDLALLAEKGFDANKLVFSVYERLGTKVVPIAFKSEKELDAFMAGKKGERLK